MLKMLLWFGLLCLVGLMPAHARTVGTEYESKIQEWRAERVEKLISNSGWLSLIGLHFLEEGDNTVGSADDNDIVLAAGPEHLGTVHLGK